MVIRYSVEIAGALAAASAADAVGSGVDVTSGCVGRGSAAANVGAGVGGVGAADRSSSGAGVERRADAAETGAIGAPATSSATMRRRSAETRKEPLTGLPFARCRVRELDDEIASPTS